MSVWETAPSCPWQPSRGESAGRWMCGSSDEAISCSGLNVSVWSVCMRHKKKIPYYPLQLSQGRVLLLPGRRFGWQTVHCWELLRTVQISLNHLVSPSQLCQKANLDWTHESPNLLAPGIPCGHSSRESHCLLTSLLPHLATSIFLPHFLKRTS